MGENCLGVIVKYHPCTRYARGSSCPYFKGGRKCGKEPLKCDMPDYDRWYKSVLARLKKVLARLEKRPGVRKPGWRVFMEEEIGKLREAYYLDDRTVERLREYFSGAASRKITKGRTIREVFYASLYLALRMLEYPVRLLDIQGMSNIKSGRIAKNYHLLVRKLGLSPPPISPEKIVYSYAKGLNIEEGTLSRAVSLIERAKREGATSGSDPFSIAATACRAEKEKVTQKEIGEAFGVTPVSIRNNAKKLNKFI